MTANYKKMTISSAIRRLRRWIGKRGDHHPNCVYRRNQTKCDCYAKAREGAHEALDYLEAYLYPDGVTLR